MRGPTEGRLIRPSARVVVVDDDGRVLLFQIVDSLDVKPPVWITPGGGLEEGESPAEAAARELGEETGLVITPKDLGPPVAVTRGDWEFRGTPMYSEDWFFARRTSAFEPDRSRWTALEHELHHDWRWWTPAELERTDELFLPAGLADLARRIAAGEAVAEPIVLPWLAV
jgi:8-oxo-dGTP pyrophosphatase MutT (NUDIX family)